MQLTMNNLSGEASAVVDNANTAVSAGSGSLPVYATPCMIALMEEATCNAASPLLDEGETTVGTAINVTHDKASGIGTRINAYATLKDVNGRELSFDVCAKDDSGAVIGQGIIKRFVVSCDRFMRRVEGQ